ncbi:MAG: PadR family transcriptional regulator [Tissierellia bacterium]|nr:PadR family transcriptional regulator [Tissierellia bacterium]
METISPLTEAFFYILLSVRQPNHGYGIIQEITQITEGRVILGPGTLYGAINSMLSKKWIQLYSEDKSSRKKKEYLITDRGKEVFAKEVKRLKEVLMNAKRMEEYNEKV